MKRSAWLVTVGEPLIGPSEPRAPLRTGHIALDLLANGWDVTWWVSSFDHLRKQPFTTPERDGAESTGVSMRWLSAPGYRKNISVARIRDHQQLAREFARAALREHAPSVIAAAVPPIELAQAVSVYCRRTGTPLVVDVRDLWPDVFEWAAPAALKPAVRLASVRQRMSVRNTLRSARAVVGVSRGYLDWGLAHAGRTANDLDAVIPIFGPGPAPDAGTLPPLPATIAPNRTIFAFVGTFGRSYDLHTVVRAARQLAPEVAEKIQIVIAGDGEERRAIQAESAGLSHLVFTGWLDRASVARLMDVSKAGLAAYSKGALQGLPNKIADYLSYGRPIVSGLAGECAELLSRSGAGWTYAPGDAANLARLLTELTNEPIRLEHASQNARALFASEFEPDRSKRRYRELLERAADRRS